MATKSLRLPTFDGKLEHYQVWITRFRAYAGVFDFSASLKNFGETSLLDTEEEDLDELDTVQVPKTKARKRNTVAVAIIMDAFIGRVVTWYTSCRQNTMHEKLVARWSLVLTNETSRNERSCLRYLPLFWPVWQLWAAVEHHLSLSQNTPIS